MQPNVARAAAALTLTLALAPLTSTLAQTGRTDSTLRSTMASRFRIAATQQQVSPDLATLAMSSTRARFVAGVGAPLASGVDDARAGVPFGMIYVEGSANVTNGFYRVALGSSGQAVLLNGWGNTAALGSATFELTAEPSNGCWFDPTPDDEHVCLKCQFGNPNGPAGAWTFATCFAI